MKEKNQTAKVNNVNKKKKKKTGIIIIIVIVLIFLAIIFAVKAAAGNVTSLVTTVAVTRGDIEESISTSGTVESEEKKTYYANLSGMVEEVKVQAGDVVSAGEQLISYDLEVAEDTYERASLQLVISNGSYNSVLSGSSTSQGKLTEANVNLKVLNQQIADNEAYLEQLQNQLSQSQRDTSSALTTESYNLNTQSQQIQSKMQSLDPTSQEYADALQQSQSIALAITRNSYLQSIASSSDYIVKTQDEIATVQERLAEYNEYKLEMESQKTTSENTILDNYDQQQYDANNELANMTFADAEKDYYSAKEGITADFEGVVTEMYTVNGATVGNGVQLLTLQSTESVKVSFGASKYDLEKLAIGQKVDITILENVYEGEISKIDRMASTNASGSAMVGVEVHILNPDENIILGLDAKLEIHTNSSQNTLLVPIEALNADKDGDFLYIVENGVVVKKPVISGISSESYVEILEGIEESDLIVQSSLFDIEEGMAVTTMASE